MAFKTFKGAIGKGGAAAFNDKMDVGKKKGKKKGFAAKKPMPPMMAKKRPDMGALSAFSS